ncbi:hypothetical protein K8I28_10695 [bacterium]|nr:hypothetical protein [bacterium]
MVSVIDTASFLHDYYEAKVLQHRSELLGEKDEPTVTDLLIDQIEFNDVILLTQVDVRWMDTIIEVMQRVLSRYADLVALTQEMVPEINRE